MGLLTYYHYHLQSARYWLKALQLYSEATASITDATSFMKKNNWNVGGMYFVLENFFSSLLYYEYIVSKIKKLLAILR